MGANCAWLCMVIFWSCKTCFFLRVNQWHGVLSYHCWVAVWADEGTVESPSHQCRGVLPVWLLLQLYALINRTAATQKQTAHIHPPSPPFLLWNQVMALQRLQHKFQKHSVVSEVVRRESWSREMVYHCFKLCINSDPALSFAWGQFN